MYVSVLVIVLAKVRMFVSVVEQCERRERCDSQ